MLLILGVLILAIAGVIASRRQALDGAPTHALGWMSEQWLSEHRASHPD